MLEVTRTDDSAVAAQILSNAIGTVHTRIVALVRSRGPSRERYAALRTRARSQAARDLIAHIRDDLEQLEQRAGKRVYKRRAKSGAKFVEAIERFVGDLLCVGAGTTGLGNIYRVVGRSAFGDANVKYDVFTKVLEGLKTLVLVGHQKASPATARHHSETLPNLVTQRASVPQASS